MTEQPITIDAGGLALEALLGERPGERGVVVTHPHPLYGGEMHNNVVQAIVEAYGARGWSTLRFNFRGVGTSGGRYEEGAGEQLDVKAALDHLWDLGKRRIDVAGYSFGAWVVARALGHLDRAARIVMVSPPVGFFDFGFLDRCGSLDLAVVGDRDAFAPVEQVREAVQLWNPTAALRIIPGADHFYLGRTGGIKEAIDALLAVDDT